jgi:hypothetical protein
LICFSIFLIFQPILAIFFLFNTNSGGRTKPSY